MSTAGESVERDWPRPVVHWEIVAIDPERQAAFYRALCHWEIGEGPIMQIPAGLGGPEPGPGGHIRQGERPAVTLYVQVRDLRACARPGRRTGRAGWSPNPSTSPTARHWLRSTTPRATRWCSSSSSADHSPVSRVSRTDRSGRSTRR